MRVKKARAIIGRAAVNQELLIAEGERRTTQVQVIHVIFIMDMMLDGLMGGVSNPFFYYQLSILELVDVSVYYKNS